MFRAVASRVTHARAKRIETFARRSRATMAVSSDKSAVTAAHAIHPPTPMRTRDPFLFCVYHRDEYPEGDEKMQSPRRGNGADFDGRAPYRMYHGDRVPGFPQVRRSASRGERSGPIDGNRRAGNGADRLTETLARAAPASRFRDDHGGDDGHD